MLEITLANANNDLKIYSTIIPEPKYAKGWGYEYYVVPSQITYGPEFRWPDSKLLRQIVADAFDWIGSHFDSIEPVTIKPLGGLSPYFERVITKNPLFKLRRLAGEIVFADYSTYTIDLGWVICDSKRISFRPVTDGTPEYPFVRVVLPGPPYKVGSVRSYYNIWDNQENRTNLSLLDNGFHKNPRIYIDAKRKTFFSFDPIVKKLRLDSIKHKWEIDSLLVTDCLSDLNGKTLDALTNLAELPETISMIYDILKKILLLLIKFKREWRRAAMSIVDVAKKPDTYASLWLQYRYGIMPLILTIEDAFKVFENWESEYVDEKKKKVISRPSPLNQDFVETQTHRVLIRRRLDISENLKQLQNQLLFNPLLTAWELIPLSFVVDWVLNVGNFIGALSTPGNIIQEAAQYSVKTECSGSNDTSFLEYKMYERVVINPQSHISFGFNVDMNPNRWADLVSLTKVILAPDQKK